jgi:hypothetical protein
LENRLDRVVTVTLLRDLSVYAGDMVVEYATSDLTARGVDEAQYQACLGISPGLRAAAGCGDYLHTSGVVLIPADATSGGFTVSIVDDLCRERFMEYIQVSARDSFCGICDQSLVECTHQIVMSTLRSRFLPVITHPVGDHLRAWLRSPSGRAAVR